MNTEQYTLPHFIIAGAMKCGTSSLHHILSQHPGIYIPDREIHFYDMDDLLQHPDFFDYQKNEWYCPNFRENLNEYLKWYSNFFKEAAADQIIGEDSTTYISSYIAPKRISEINPRAKIIVMLRDPASRSYSHYFHLFRTGRVSEKFEKCIFKEETIIQRSLYKLQIEFLLKYIPRERIKFVVFEEFITNMNKTVNDILEFIEVDDSKMDLADIDTHKNKHKIPFSITMQLLTNKMFKGMSSKRRYYGHLPYDIYMDKFKESIYIGIQKINRIINPLTDKDKPRMRSNTRILLNNYFINMNEGVNRLVGFEIDKHWYDKNK